MAEYYSYRLSKSHIIPLLLQYKKHPCLWDPNDGNYKNHDNRMRILKNISHDLRLGMTVGQLKTRLKNLRTTYVREVSRVVRSKKNGEQYKPRLAWFGVADSFLRRVIAPRGDTDTESNGSVLEETEVSLEQHFEDNFVNTDVELEGVILKQEEDFQERFNVDSNLGENSSINEYVCQKDTRSSEQLCGGRGAGAGVQGGEDEFATFGRHVANQLRCLPLREAVRSQNFIHNFLSNKRLKYLEKRS